MPRDNGGKAAYSKNKTNKRFRRCYAMRPILQLFRHASKSLNTQFGMAIGLRGRLQDEIKFGHGTRFALTHSGNPLKHIGFRSSPIKEHIFPRTLFARVRGVNR
jgi:hypothetical protein